MRLAIALGFVWSISVKVLSVPGRILPYRSVSRDALPRVPFSTPCFGRHDRI
jgi:hypothetical protein